MRNLKFRVWSKEEKRWLDLNGFGIGFKGSPWEGEVISVSEQGVLHYFECGRDLVLEQFTGLKDKNGVEIYEGDIVIAYSEGSKAAFEVKWGDGRVGFFLFNKSVIQGWSLSGGGPEYNQEVCEVIGNIHQNPELLKVEVTK